MTTNDIKQNEQGIVAILVTMIIMIVLSLIVTGFAQLARREQREALDRQLASQALYAAESGINDARQAMTSGYTQDKNTCGPIEVDHLRDNTVSSDGDGVISYSCLLIKQILPNTQHVVTTNESRIIPVNTVNSAGTPVTIDRLTFSWTAQGGGVGLPGRPVGDFPPVNAWGNARTAGVLRVDIIPAASLQPNSLNASMFTFFAYPTTGAATVVPAVGTNNGQVVGAGCSSNSVCQVSVAALPTSDRYYVRVKAIYNAADVRMCFAACDGTVSTRNTQAEVDVTGKANDVLKRVKTRLNTASDLVNMDNFPEYVVTSKNQICKRLEVRPGYTESSGLTTCGL